MKKSLWNLVAGRHPELLAGKDQKAVSDQEMIMLSRMAVDIRLDRQDVSLDDIRDKLWSAVSAFNKDAYLTEVYPSYLIYELNGKYFRVDWSILDDAAQLGTQAVEMEKTWIEVRIGQGGDESDLSLIMRLGQAKNPEGSAWDVTICEPGFTLNNSYIPDELLRQSVPLFEGVGVNMYELPEGATHIPGPLFDLKSLLVSNKVGWIDNVRYVAGKGLQGVLHFLDSAKSLGRNLMDAMSQGAKVYGLSWDCLIRGTKAVIEGRSVLRIDAFKDVNSVDIVTRPAAGGKFNRAVAAMPAHHKEDAFMKERLWKMIQKTRPALLTGKDLATISDQDLEGLARMAMEPEKFADLTGMASKDDLAIIRGEMALKDGLVKSDLPELAKERIKKTFEGRVFQAADLDKAIADEKDYLAKINPQPNLGDGVAASGIHFQGGLGSIDRACMAVDRLFGIQKDQVIALAGMERLDHNPVFADMRNVQDYTDFDKVPAFKSLREMYYYFTGDAEVNGRFNRKNLPAELRSSMDINSGTFSYVLGNTLARRLVSQYLEFKFQEELLISVRKPVKDFRQQEAVLVGGFSDLSTVDPEAADYQEISGVTDEESTYTLGQRGNLLTITRKTIINDDVSIIQRLVNGLSRAARRTHAKYVWNFFINNGTCTDTTAWFTVGHGNLGATALGFATALAAYIALGKMTEKDSAERLGFLADPSVKPNLIGPIDLVATLSGIANDEFYFTANDLTTKIRNALAGKVNAVAIPLFTDTNDWGLILPPGIADIVEMGYLNGRQEPELFVADSPMSEQVFVADKNRYKIRHEYAGAVIDYRTGYKAVVA